MMDIYALFQLAILTPILFLVGYGFVQLAKHLRDNPESPLSCLSSLVAVPLLYFGYVIFFYVSHPFNFMCYAHCERANRGVTEYAVAGLLNFVLTIVGLFPARVIGNLAGWSWFTCTMMSIGFHTLFLTWLWTR